ncbi:MAG: hypothetical protein HY868_27610 [Chloroflexi bacterium]|nr:hypothetical protein [Chloroflexota bacterium]
MNFETGTGTHNRRVTDGLGLWGGAFLASPPYSCISFSPGRVVGGGLA